LDEKRQLLKHFLAAIAYRTQKALRGAPESYATYRVAPGVRTPHELIFHMSSVLGYARTFFVGGSYRPSLKETFAEEVERFHETLEDLGRHLDAGTNLRRQATPERLLQGPFADAMTHAGQLAMLRRLCGSPIPPENFFEVEISDTNLSPAQPEPTSADNHWHDAEVEPRGP
jgi:hypothetical protein